MCVCAQLTFPALNLALYNVFGIGGDSTLYGADTHTHAGTHARTHTHLY